MQPLGRFVICILSVAPMLVTSIQKRSDDTSTEALLALIQQQAATISALQAAVNSQHAAISLLQSRQSTMDSTLQQHTASINSAVSRLNSRVAFTAVMSHSGIIITDSPFPFQRVINNIGGGYNPNSGIFTAPVSGDYIFYAQILGALSSDGVAWAIVKDSAAHPLCDNYLSENTPFFNTASCLATVHLQTGETVFVIRVNTGSHIDGNLWSSFSGQLISADP